MFFIFFCVVIFFVGNRHRTQPISCPSKIEPKDVRASTLPRRRGNSSPVVSSPTQSPGQQSPCASTPSVDSAVGSAEGLGVNQSTNIEEHRPRSDGSDSLATSSALTSPEPPPVPEGQEIRPDITRQDSSTPSEQTATENIHQESNNDKSEYKGLIFFYIYLFILFNSEGMNNFALIAFRKSR